MTDLALNLTGAVFVVAGVVAVCAVLLTPLSRRSKDVPLLQVEDPVELGWVATARLLRPALWTALIAGGLNLLVRLVDAAAS